MSYSVNWAIQRAFLHANRKTIMPVGAKYDALLAIADSVQKMWSSEPGTEWDSLYSLETIGTAGTSTSYDLPDEVASISKNENDPVVLTNGTQRVKYLLVRPNQLERYRDSQVCAKIGRSLVFPKAFTSDMPTYGYSIIVPCYLNVDDITKGTDEIQVDDPMWLVYMMAAEFDRNDIIKVAQYSNLLQLADQSMQGMKADNGGQLEQVSSPGGWLNGESWT